MPPTEEIDDGASPAVVASRRTAPFYRQLWFLLLAARGSALRSVTSTRRVEVLGDAFIKAIRMLIAPIIFCTVVHG